jgi:ATP-dependent Clp protease ATP-binding subunit ClpC
MAKLCDVCRIRPATVRAVVTRDGQRETLDLCEVDYRRLARQSRSSSPLESLFGETSSLFEDFFGDRATSDSSPEATTGDGPRTIPVRSLVVVGRLATLTSA